MLLILTDANDLSSLEVIDWLCFYNVPFIRINKETKISLKNVQINPLNPSFEIHYIDDIDHTTKQLHSKTISCFWYRRGFFAFKIKGIRTNPSLLDNYEHAQGVTDLLNFYLRNEHQTIEVFIHQYLKHIPYIGRIFHNKTNKLYNLYIAAQSGLKVPDTIVTTSKTEIEQFITKHNGHVITKALDHGTMFYKELGSIYGMTVSVEDIPMISATVYPSLLQEKLDKAYELRVFYLDGMCYASAIFSQLDNQTAVDFRNYNVERPNRTPPFKLPPSIKDKIVQFMTAINMKSGSLDIVVTRDKEYVFLEVNPVGQFKQVSYPCNYYLEQKLAQYFYEKYQQAN